MDAQLTESFGSVLFRERKNRKISQVDLAKILGVSQPTIGKWERGESEPRFSELVSLFATLKLPFEYFENKTRPGSALHISAPVQNTVGDNSNGNRQSISINSDAAPCAECERKDAEIARLTRECERLSRECERAAAALTQTTSITQK